MYNHEVPFLFTANMYIAFHLNRLNFLIRMGYLIVPNGIHVITPSLRTKYIGKT